VLSLSKNSRSLFIAGASWFLSRARFRIQLLTVKKRGKKVNNFYEFGCIDDRADQLGVKILAIDFQAKIVLADNGRDFVTWRYSVDQDASCHFEHGHYFGYSLTSKNDHLSEAREDYEHRVSIEFLSDKTYRIAGKNKLEVTP